MAAGARPAWSVYLVRRADGALYTGIATDVERRLLEHAQPAGRGARALRGRGPLRVVYRRRIGSRSSALRIEALIKRKPKSWKERLVRRRESLGPLLDRIGLSSAAIRAGLK